MKKHLPLLSMILLQVIIAIGNVLSKVALDEGMQPHVFVTYRQILATVATVPLSIIFERKRWKDITKPIIWISILCSTIGATLHYLLFYFGLQHSSPIISAATANAVPAITFIIGIIFRQEKLMIKEWAGKAKLLGTCISVGGATILAFYHGGVFTNYKSKIIFRFASRTKDVDPTPMGAALIIVSHVCTAVWLVIQTGLSKKFPAPWTNTTLLCFFSSVQCAVISVIIDPNPYVWSIALDLKLFTILYAGIVSSGIGFFLKSWAAGNKGPLYVSVFGPVSLILVAILGWTLLEHKLYNGTLIGGLLIFVGLYMVLWGKSKEQTQVVVEQPGGVQAEQLV